MFFQSAFTRPGAFALASLNLSLYFEASYAGAPWVGQASAGASLANGNLATNASDPATGAAQNGYTPADFNGSANNLINGTAASTLFTAGAGSIVALFRPDTAAAPTGNVYDDPALYHDSGFGNTGLTYTTSGFQGFITASGVYKSKAVAAATGSYHLVMMRWDGTNLGMTLNSAAETTQAAGNATVGAGTVAVGRGYASTYIDGRMLMLLTSATKLSTTDYANIKAYVNTRYALAL